MAWIAIKIASAQQQEKRKRSEHTFRQAKGQCTRFMEDAPKGCPIPEHCRVQWIDV
jgi:hypothetical protein